MSEAQTIPLPRETGELVGHQAAESAMAEAVASGKIPHAWLITGPSGIGKATLAYRFARHILSGAGAAEDEGPGLFGDALPATPAGLHVPRDNPVFSQIAAGSHPDMLVVERGYDEKRKKMRGEIVIDDVRQIGSFLRLTPSLGGWRVVVLDSADEMNRNAANAVLKLLEEPPRQALLLLVSHAPGRLLPTIRSRCRAVRLGPLSDAQVAELLAKHLPELDQATSETLVALSEGSIGRALSLAAEGGIDALRELFRALESYPQIKDLAVLELADKWTRATKAEETDPFETGTALLDWWLGRIARDAASGDRPVDRVPGMGAAAEKLAAALGPAGIAERRAVISAMLGRGSRLSLDKRQMLMDAFQLLAPDHAGS
ncbi:DNA polymerase III subunit delta' [Nisaea sediminum]|uniref:DNA polymerase III subunit delta' n=1 Tax=Nisaea sediminum TaxID=2775867 RepID=UPI0018666081|nr:DNA polymerase III subunit delta' [Nisaea sediminum]